MRIAAFRRDQAAFLVACIAVAWALIFSTLHLIWAVGWHVGLDADLASVAFQRRWFAMYNLLVAVASALGAATAWIIAESEQSGSPRQLVTAATFVGAALLGMQAGAGVLQAIYVTATAGDVTINSLLWEFWFLTGAVLFGFLAWRDRRGAFPFS